MLFCVSMNFCFYQDPLFRFFEREVKMGGKMLQEVRQDLTDVVHVCGGKKKQTNDLRTLINDLVKGNTDWSLGFSYTDF